MYVVVHHRVIDRDNFLATDPREIAGNVPPGDTTYGFRPLERLVDATGGRPCRSSGWRNPSTRACSSDTACSSTAARMTRSGHTKAERRPGAGSCQGCSRRSRGQTARVARRH